MSLIEETYNSRTSLGADLRAIRTRIVASGVPLLTKEQVLEQVREWRGGSSDADPRG